MPGFHNNPEPQTRTTPTAFDRRAATELYNALEAKRLLIGRPRTERWAQHIRKLRTVDNIASRRIQEVMLWYTKHLREPFVPHAYTAEAFREKFLNIEAAMARTDTVPSTAQLATTAAREEERRLGLRWPANTNPDEVLLAIQASLDNFGVYTRTIIKLRNEAAAGAEVWGRHKPGRPSQLFFQWLWDVTPATETLMMWWFTELHQMAHRWAGWRGNIRYWAWHSGARWWVARMEQELKRYNGQPDMWPDLKRLIDEG